MYLFLDIDGVMVPANSWRKPDILADGFYSFNQKAVNALNQILNYKRSHIILSTSHKYRYSLDQWLNIFKSRGVYVNSLSRLAENNEYLNRKEEILKWFETNKALNGFLIIDDDKSLNALPKRLKENLILTDSSIGLNTYNAEEAINKIDKFVVEHAD